MKTLGAAATAAAFVALCAGGCSLTAPPEGDRLFAAGDLTAALSAYEEMLDRGRATGRRHERALYHLGLIHARPDGQHYDPAAARGYLERLLAVEPPSPYATQAALVLELQLEAAELRAEMADQRGLARLLLAELRRLRSEAEEIESAATGEQARARQLALQIERLQGKMEELAAELAAREEELERLKRIDLEDPP